ncbi:MAG TPA: XRE family transcriptional regulator [Pseudonocardia sp.]
MQDPDSSAQVSRAVAANLRSLRARRNWSLDQLAHRSGVSKGVLVALEGDRGNPSLSTLCRLSEAFSVSLSDLVDTERPATLRRSTVEEAAELWHGPAGGSGRLVLSTDPPNPVELWLWEMAPGEGISSEAHVTGTREALLVLDGELTVESDQHSAVTPSHTAVTFPGDKPHAYRNRGTEPTRFIMIITVPQ